MAWKYEQLTGRLFDPEGNFVAHGYSGGGIDPHNAEAVAGKNNPEMQNIHDVGPLPEGIWIVGEPVNSMTHGKYAMKLTPQIGTETFGRDHFLMHGDSLIRPGFASEGCCVEPFFARVKLWESGDHLLECVKEMPTRT